MKIYIGYLMTGKPIIIWIYDWAIKRISFSLFLLRPHLYGFKLQNM